MNSPSTAWTVFSDAESVAREAASAITSAVRERPNLVLGLATGSTPIRLYELLVEAVSRGELDLSEVRTFNLDEYLGLAPGHPASFREFMRRTLFDPAGIGPEQVAFPDAADSHRERAATAYEQAIRITGGIDLQILGIGRNGHIGFNEPGAASDGRTTDVNLAESTRRDARVHFETESEVPRRAITMGVGTILDARQILLLACGVAKATAVAEALTSAEGSSNPAAWLRDHNACRFLLDRSAASRLPQARSDSAC